MLGSKNDANLGLDLGFPFNRIIGRDAALTGLWRGYLRRECPQGGTLSRAEGSYNDLVTVVVWGSPWGGFGCLLGSILASFGCNFMTLLGAKTCIVFVTAFGQLFGSLLRVPTLPDGALA